MSKSGGRWYKSLFVQLLVAVVAGVLVGHFWPVLGAELKPVGDGFIRLIKMIIAPLIFCVVVTGIAAIGAFPVAGVALLLGADRLMDSMRVFVNLLGNCVATFVVAKSEKQLDREKMLAALEKPVPEPAVTSASGGS